MRVLIVEDEVVIAWMLADSLEGAGHEVIGPVAAMAEALALCEGALPPPELAVLDINPRDGSNGVDVARALLERWGVPSIFVSAQTVEARWAREVALGCIRKPYRPETVLQGVEVAREVMDGRTPRHVPAGFELFSAAE
jgi:two-component system, response regulator PdtaR